MSPTEKSTSNLKITLVKSIVTTRHDHRQTVKRLGLNRIGQSIVKPDTPSIRGMANKINYLIELEQI